MKPSELVLRCFAEKKEGQWQALCLDLCLAAQADTFEEAREKLDRMICSYVHDAVAGKDREFAEQLLSRRAPLRDWVRYYTFMALIRLGAVHQGARRLFSEALPMQPVCHV